MSELQQITQYLQSIGPENDNIAGVLQTADNEWQVIFDEHMQVQMTFHEASRKLLLSIDLGTPPVDRRLQVLETLLSCNLLTHENGGVRMAMAGPVGDALMVVDLDFNELNESLLSTVLDNFSTLGYSWKAFVQTQTLVEETATPVFSMFTQMA